MSTVSVIIPTVGRDALRKAVVSVLTQEGCEPTPIVVLDAPDRREEVEALLEGLRYELHVTDKQGASVARNVGLDAATGEYIGYLDDDDFWLPHKAAAQIAAIESSDDPQNTFSVGRSAFRREDGKVDLKGPTAFDPNKQTLANHLVARRRFRFGAVCFNTPGIFGPAGVIKAVKWDGALRKHQDWDLLIRLENGRNVVVVDEVLSVVNQGSPGSISRLNDWTAGYEWLMKHSGEVTGRSRADFVLLQMMLSAVRARSWEGVRTSLQAMGATVPHLAAVVRFVAGIALGK